MSNLNESDIAKITAKLKAVVIERTDKEYMADIRKQYETEMKPLLDQGISMTEAFRRMGVGCGKGARKHRELRRIALERGYRLRR